MQYDSDHASQKIWIKRSLILAAVSLVATFFFVEVLVGKNSMHTWQVIQYANGDLEIRNRPGWYVKWLARVTTYPRMVTVYGTKGSRPESIGDDSVRALFNDGGYADISYVIRVLTPAVEEEDWEDPERVDQILLEQREFHRQFTGNVENVKNVARSIVQNIIPKTGPIMSSTENQSARKGEFLKTCHDQIRDGLYRMKPVEVKAETGVKKMIEAMQQRQDEQAHPGQDDEKQSPSVALDEHSITASETVVAAEIVYDPQTGSPIIDTPSPLKQYSMRLAQFSILDTDYDGDTLKKFSDKKKLYLQAEESKARAIQNVQQRFQRVAQGEREVAEREWVAEEERMRQKIQAETKQEREVIVKETKRIESETLALVEGVKKQEQEIMKDIAQTEAKIAENEKQAAEIAAKAREQQIEIAGAISEHDRGLAEISVKEAELVAGALKQLQVPDIVIMTPEAFDPSKGTALQQALPSMQLLQLFGLMEENHELKVPPRKSTVKTDTPVATKVNEQSTAN